MKKRIGAIVCLAIMAASTLTTVCFAESSNSSEGGSNFSIVSTTPQNGDTGVSVENLSVKIYFDTDMIPESDEIKESNADQFTLTSADGDTIATEVYYSEDEEGLMMVISDPNDTDIEIEGATDYTLTIGENLQATDGSTLGETITIDFTTLDQSKSMAVYMILMVVMFAGMIFFSTRATKKKAEDEKAANAKRDPVNPYKEAKRTGKSVEEIISKENKRKAKEAEKLAKQKKAQEELEAEIEAELDKREAAESHKRVSGPRPISDAGSSYKVAVKKPTRANQDQSGGKKSNKQSSGNGKAYHTKGTTNPKNQTGKQKNSKKKSNSGNRKR